MYKEHLIASDYLIRVEKPSKFAAGKTWIDDENELLGCPRCHHVLVAPKHGERIKCYHCHLSIERWGNGLDLWEGEKNGN